jgi:hypothetical protein
MNINSIEFETIGMGMYVTIDSQKYQIEQWAATLIIEILQQTTIAMSDVQLLEEPFNSQYNVHIQAKKLFVENKNMFSKLRNGEVDVTFTID